MSSSRATWGGVAHLGRGLSYRARGSGAATGQAISAHRRTRNAGGASRPRPCGCLRRGNGRESGDARRLRAQFDALVMGELIEHVPYPVLEEFISSTARVLSQGGRVLLTTPNPHYLFLRWRGGSVLGGAHVSVHCPAALTELPNHRGFRVVRVEGTGRMSRAIGVRFPLSFYGSFVHIAWVSLPPRND